MTEPTIYNGHVFNRKPMTYQWRRGLHDLSEFITPAMRAQAATLDEKDWGLDGAQILDQGNTPHCVGFGWATWGNCPPVNDAYKNLDAHNIYYEAVAIGGYPRSEDGAETEWGVKAMVARRRTDKFAWVSSIDDMVVWLLTKGPLVTGLVWTTGMEAPDGNGIMRATGAEIGGHETCWSAVSKKRQMAKVDNSWSKTWALGGSAWMSLADMADRLNHEGDCCTAVELPLTPAPEPTPQPAPSGCLPFLASALRGIAGNTSLNEKKRIARALRLAAGDLEKAR